MLVTARPYQHPGIVPKKRDEPLCQHPAERLHRPHRLLLIPISAGLLPAIYRDGRVMTAVYAIPFEAARAAVAPPELHPILLPAERAVAVVSWFDYRDTTLGPYHELGIGVVVSTRRRPAAAVMDLMSSRPETGAWLVALPVSSALACRGGVEQFGYPKTVCDLSVQYSTSNCLAIVQQDSTPVLSLSLPLGRGPRFPVRTLVTYSRKDGHLLRTRIETRWNVTVCSGRATSLELHNPQYSLCQALQQLALPNKPLFVLHGDAFRATLTAGERV